jgi:hypothetical protein
VLPFCDDIRCGDWRTFVGTFLLICFYYTITGGVCQGENWNPICFSQKIPILKGSECEPTRLQANARTVDKAKEFCQFDKGFGRAFSKARAVEAA